MTKRKPLIYGFAIAFVIASILGASSITPGGATAAAVVYQGSAVTTLTTSGTAYTLSFDTETLNNGPMHSTVSNPTRLTFPVTGYYTGVCQVRFAVNATGYRQVTIKVNGAGAAVAFSVLPSAGSVNDTISQAVMPITKFNAGDYVECLAVQSSGGSLNTVLADTKFAAWRVY